MVRAGGERLFLFVLVVLLILLDLFQRAFPGAEVNEEQHDHKGDGKNSPGVEERIGRVRAKVRHQTPRQKRRRKARELGDVHACAGQF
ncbi:hypothetical protein D3C85_1345140 [compost metagenome]